MTTVEQEQLVRHAAFLGLHERITTTEASFELVPLTLRKFAALSVMQSPYLPPFKTPTEGDTIALLWVLSPGWQPNAAPKLKRKFYRQRFDFVPPMPPYFWRTRRALGKQVVAEERARVSHAEMVCALRDFIAEAYQDAPMGNGQSLLAPVEYYSDEIAIASDLAREYGGGLDMYLDMPLKLVFQAMKELREYRAAKAGRVIALSNPSDAITAAELAASTRVLHESGKTMHPDAVAYFKARNN